MRVGCYSMDIYCTHCPEQISVGNEMTRTESQCLKRAKQEGWITTLNKELCPKCQPRPKRKSSAYQVDLSVI